MIKKALFSTSATSFVEVQEQLEESITTFFGESVYIMVVDTPHIVGDPIAKASVLLGCKPVIITE